MKEKCMSTLEREIYFDILHCFAIRSKYHTIAAAISQATHFINNNCYNYVDYDLCERAGITHDHWKDYFLNKIRNRQ